MRCHATNQSAFRLPHFKQRRHERMEELMSPACVRPSTTAAINYNGRLQHRKHYGASDRTTTADHSAHENACKPRSPHRLVVVTNPPTPPPPPLPPPSAPLLPPTPPPPRPLRRPTLHRPTLRWWLQKAWRRPARCTTDEVRVVRRSQRDVHRLEQHRLRLGTPAFRPLSAVGCGRSGETAPRGTQARPEPKPEPQI